MKNLRYLVAVPVIALSIASVGLTTNHAAADTDATACTVKADGASNTIGAADSRFEQGSDGTVTVAFTVTGNQCDEPLTLASWTAPDADKGLPYSAQKLFKSTVGAFSEGKHSLTVALPGDNCFYQVDLVEGIGATDSNGGPQYKAVDGRKILGSLHGGIKVCEGGHGGETPVPPTTPTVLPNTGTSTNVMVSLAAVSTLFGAAISHLRLVRKYS